MGGNQSGIVGCILSAARMHGDFDSTAILRPGNVLYFTDTRHILGENQKQVLRIEKTVVKAFTGRLQSGNVPGFTHFRQTFLQSFPAVKKAHRRESGVLCPIGKVGDFQALGGGDFGIHGSQIPGSRGRSHLSRGIRRREDLGHFIRGGFHRLILIQYPAQNQQGAAGGQSHIPPPVEGFRLPAPDFIRSGNQILRKQGQRVMKLFPGHRQKPSFSKYSFSPTRVRKSSVLTLLSVIPK